CQAYALSMPEPAQVATQKTAASFANLLTSFTGRLQSDAWDNSALADDVAVLTYEQALRSTRRARLPEFQPVLAAVHPDGEREPSGDRPEHSSAEKKCRTAVLRSVT